jgi:hypothetical protein
MTFDTNVSDTTAMHSTSSNTSRICPQGAGLYVFMVNLCTNTEGNVLVVAMGKNTGGVLAPASQAIAYNGNNTNGTYGAMPVQLVSPPIAMNGSTDYVECFMSSNGGGWEVIVPTGLWWVPPTFCCWRVA